MADAPWLTIVGLGEDGPAGLSPASREALDRAEIVMGPPRHLALLPEIRAELVEWPVPFADGIARLLKLRGRPVVVLASGDPFWFGAGSVIARHLQPEDWRALPGVSVFALAVARLGWPLDTTLTLGLHAAPLTRVRPYLMPGQRAIVLLRDGAAVAALADLLVATGFGESTLHVCEALGGPRERLRSSDAATLAFEDVSHPVCVGLEVAGQGVALPLTPGRPDTMFENDGQITKGPMRALTLAALAPRPGERLWDIGGGSGSVAIEWLLSHPSLSATTIDPNPDRIARIRRNADQLGVDRLDIVKGHAPAALRGLPPPDAVFIGGGVSADMLTWLGANLPGGTRLVANAVTLESEALLADAQEKRGGNLLRIELAQAEPLGSKRGWKAAYPVVQWSVML
ncbi:precorrin-6y C5,15-methyltransferase (decarboxylating) subunit CbiE [Sedimentitalea todarodis]|uniref:Precorrin-6y C5,15-methyltransferase (Decarboxylating) subunit CbiE n=1 Tax=Sedimentitalea todarodis TaxID=1631240 RepID=A0ABU3VHQ9_9RHOB|nr:precorrin-6y C5,15-methyltransferase (decarboxylating) subunit CbiE [Sedimentitalea todarodis]MDU9005700.1 precorrin-6y C5,15-methyltransferase (decarboxylating) subunit CbiE [Sedimentitalea todarodis]